MRQAARLLRARRRTASSPAELVDLALRFEHKDTFIRPLQLSNEATELLTLVERLRPKRVLEIGTASGGTLFLFAAVASSSAHLVSIDWNPFRDHPCNATRLKLYRRLGTRRQRIDVIAGDSHDPDMPERIAGLFGDPVDFVFVDGDHSFEGVKLDAERYLPLLRPGGLAAFHDIVPDVPRESTGVGDWWREFAATHQVEEIVEDREQAGYGIGIWRRPSD